MQLKDTLTSLNDTQLPKVNAANTERVILDVITAGDAVGARQASFLVETFAILDPVGKVFKQRCSPHMHMLICRTQSPLKLITLARLRNQMLSKFLATTYSHHSFIITFRYRGVAGDNKHTCELSASGGGSVQDRCQLCDARADTWQRMWTEKQAHYSCTPNSERISRYTMVLLNTMFMLKGNHSEIMTKDNDFLGVGLSLKHKRIVHGLVKEYRLVLKVRGFPLVTYHNDSAIQIVRKVCLHHVATFFPESAAQIQRLAQATSLLRTVFQLDSCLLDRVYIDPTVDIQANVDVDACDYLPSFMHNLKAVILSYILHFLLRSVTGKKRTTLATSMLESIGCKSFFEHFYGKKARACVALGPSHSAFSEIPLCYRQQLGLLTIIAAVFYTHTMKPWHRAMLRVCIPLFFLSLDMTKTVREKGCKRWHNNQEVKADAKESEDAEDEEELLNDAIVSIEEAEHMQNILAKPSLYAHAMFHICQLLDKKAIDQFDSFLRIGEEAIERKCGDIKLYDNHSGSATVDDCMDYARSHSVWTDIMRRQNDMSSVRGHDVAGTDKSMLKGVVIFADNMSFLPTDFFTDLGNSNDDVKTYMFEISGYENAFYIVFDDDSHALFKRDDRGKLNKKRLEDNFHVICFCKCTHSKWEQEQGKIMCAFHEK